MRSFVAATLSLLAFGSVLRAEDREIEWGKSFINARREAAVAGCPMVVLFCDELSLDYYDDVLGRDPKLRAAQKGIVFCKVKREREQDLAKKLAVKSPWEVRILAPDLTVLKSFSSKPKGAEVATVLKGLQKIWSSRGGPKSIDWMFSYDEALKLAREKNRPLLMYFWWDEKRGSNPDDNPLLRNERVVQISKRFFCVKLNKSVEQELFDRFKIEEIPQILFVKPNEDPYEALDVSLKIEALLTVMKDIAREYGEETVESGGKQ